MTLPISCILLVPTARRAQANTLINGYGFGANNLSVELVKTSDSSTWYGCHIWCDQAFVNFIQAHQSEFAGTMIMSNTSGPAISHWWSELTANGMTVAPEH